MITHAKVFFAGSLATAALDLLLLFLVGTHEDDADSLDATGAWGPGWEPGWGQWGAAPCLAHGVPCASSPEGQGWGESSIRNTVEAGSKYVHGALGWEPGWGQWGAAPCRHPMPLAHGMPCANSREGQVRGECSLPDSLWQGYIDFIRLSQGSVGPC